MDEQKIKALAERVLTEVNGALGCLTILIGHRLGLYRNLADEGSATPAELAARTGLAVRYVEEWLLAQVTGGYLDHDSATGEYSISPEHSAVFVDQDNPAYMTPFTQWITTMSAVIPELTEAFRTGGGVPYEAYGQDAIEAIGLGNRSMFVNDYARSWIPALPDVEAKLKNGGKVAEVGCGIGWSSIALAHGFPTVAIDGIDIDEASITQARDLAEEQGVSDRVAFHHTPVEQTELTGPYDLVTAFECLHDMPYPIDTLTKMRELAGPSGVVLIADEAAGDTLEENTNLLGNFFYNASILHCLPQAMVFPDAAGTGTAISPSTVRTYAEQAGFKSVEVVDIENPFFRFYRLAP